jgi:hypothetical protein
MTQQVTEGAIVVVQGHEFRASNVVWSDETRWSPTARRDEPTGLRLVRFTGTCTDHPSNDDIRSTGYNGATYGGNTWAGYTE